MASYGFGRVGLVGIAAAMAAFASSPAPARDAVAPAPAICAAMYFTFAGDNKDDPNYRAMQQLARKRGAYTRAVQTSPGFSEYQPLSDAEAVEKDKQTVVQLFKDNPFQDSEGLTQQYLDQFYICSVAYNIRPPANAMGVVFDADGFEAMWAVDAGNHQRKLAAEEKQAQTNANYAARDQAYGQANSALSSCMSMPSSVSQFHSDYPAYTQAKWKCEDIRREAIRIAQSSGDNAAAQGFINIRFPWQ